MSRYSAFQSLERGAAQLGALFRPSAVAGLYGYGYAQAADAPDVAQHALSHAELLDVLLMYYHSNALYERLGYMETNRPRSIRTPVSSFVGFYRDHLWSEGVPVAPEDGTLAEGYEAAIKQLRDASNWRSRADLAAFDFALFGELLIKSAQREGSREPFHQLIDPRHVKSIESDPRGYVTWAEIETPYKRRDRLTGKQEERLRVEVWEPGRVRLWDVLRRVNRTDLAALGPPQEERWYGGPVGSDLPVDFVPIAYARFAEERGERGTPPLLLAIEAIDEANRLASRANDQLRTQRADKQLVNVQSNPTGQALLTPDFDENEFGEIVLGGESVFRLPQGWRLDSLIASLDFAAMREMTADQVEQVRTLLPELEYFKISTESEQSGRALRYRLAPAIARAERVRYFAESALILATQHAVSIGERAGVWSFGTEADWDEGRMALAFEDEDIIPPSREEIEENERAEAEARARVAETLAGITGNPYGAMLVAGYSEEDARKATQGDNAPPPPPRAAEELDALDERASARLERIGE